MRKRTMAEYRLWLQLSPYSRRNRDLDYQEASHYMRENKAVEPTICKQFSCGKTLRSQEMLSGEYCIHHSKRETKNQTI